MLARQIVWGEGEKAWLIDMVLFEKFFKGKPWCEFKSKKKIKTPFLTLKFSGSQNSSFSLSLYLFLSQWSYGFKLPKLLKNSFIKRNLFSPFPRQEICMVLPILSRALFEILDPPNSGRPLWMTHDWKLLIYWINNRNNSRISVD